MKNEYVVTCLGLQMETLPEGANCPALVAGPLPPFSESIFTASSVVAASDT
jgi:hypothetical protein